MTTKYRLHYFEGRVRCEGIRYLFLYAGVPYENFGFSIDQWENRDSSIPFELYTYGQVPVLEVTENGKTTCLAQSLTIARFLARRFGLAGKTDLEASQCDEIADALQELLNLAIAIEDWSSEQFKNDARERLKTKDYQRILGPLEARLKANGGKHMVGSDWTWADFTVSWYLRGLKDYNKSHAQLIDGNFKALAELAKAVEQIPAISKYIPTRPGTWY